MTGGRPVVIGDRYELIHRLGAGGMAEVWLAADLRLNRKQVAVKRLLGFRAGTPGSALDLERARREAFAASRLSHANLVAVTDFVAEAGEPFIVMEYVPGTTLGDLVGPDGRAAGGLPDGDAARIMGQVAAALAEAHDADLIHRDVKPANIMVTTRGDAKLTDFGIARSSADPRFTRSGAFTGTVPYLAPEVLDGQPATTASDMWSFGATLYEAVEGKRAFDGPTMPAILMAIAAGPPPRPAGAGPLAELIGELLDRDPRLRPIAEVTAQRVRALASPAARGAFAPPAGGAPPTVLTPGVLRSPAEWVQPPWPAPHGPSPAPWIPEPGGSPALSGAAVGDSGFSPPRYNQPAPAGPPAAGGTPPAGGPPGFGPPLPPHIPRRPGSVPKSRRRGYVVIGAFVAIAALIGGVLFATTRSGGNHPLAGNGGPPTSTHRDSGKGAPAPGAAPGPSGAPSATAGPSGTVTIGFQGALSGPDAELGIDERNGITLALQQANGSGDHTFTTRLVAVDDQGDAGRAPSAAATLIANPRVLGVLGPTFSSTAAAAGPAYGAAGLALISPSAAVTALAGRYPTFHRVLASDSAEAAAAAPWLMRRGVRRLFILEDGESYGTTSGTALATAARQLGIDTAVKSVAVTPGTDFVAVARQIEAAHPDAVYYGGLDSDAGRFARALAAAAYHGVAFGGSGVKSGAFAKTAGAAGNGWYLTCGCIDPTAATSTRAFARAYTATFHASPSTYAAEAYDATTAMLAAIRHAGSAPTRASVEAALRSVDFQGITSRISFTSTGELQHPTVYLYRVRNGRIAYAGDIAKQS